jgi:predicted negative regulator of RcsB-dependent stress response
MLEPKTSWAKIFMWILIIILIIGIVAFIVYKYYIQKNEEER